MPATGRLTQEEWDELEPLLAAADRAAHDQFMQSPDAKGVLGGSDATPGYQLLQRLKELGDRQAIGLFRAAEMYHHEITRADIAAAYLAGKRAGRAAPGSAAGSEPAAASEGGANRADE